MANVSILAMIATGTLPLRTVALTDQDAAIIANQNCRSETSRGMRSQEATDATLMRKFAASQQYHGCPQVRVEVIGPVPY